MKKLYIIIAMLCIAVSTWAQHSTPQTVYLKNGSIVKCAILEQIPDKSIKIRTADGSIFVYEMSEVEKIALSAEPQKTQSAKTTVPGRHKGLDFDIQAGYMFGVGDMKGYNTIPLEVGLGKQINQDLYLGLGTGAWLGQAGSTPSIPIALKSRVLMPTRSGTVTPFIGVALAYSLSTKRGSSFTDEEGNTHKSKIPDAVALEFMPGVSIPMSKTTDFLVSAGYIHSFSLSGGGGGGSAAVKVGVNFHKNPLREKRGPRPKKGTRTNGMMLGLDGGALLVSNNSMCMGVTGNGCVSYKFNPHFSAGIGFFLMATLEQNYNSDMLEIDSKGNQQTEQQDIEAYMIGPFVRGTYQILDKRLSPLVECDLGYGFGTILQGMKHNDEDTKTTNKPFVRPAIGASLRLTSNTYLELKASYCLMSKIAPKKEYLGSSWTSYKPFAITGPAVSIGFKYNLKALSR